MKTTVVVMLLVILATACSRKTYTEEDGPVTVKAGKEFIIKLPASPSTGYKWHEVKTIDTTLLNLKLVDYEIKDPKLDGGVGHELWIFEAIKKGKTEVCLKYWRPWDKNSAIDTVTFAITIQ